MNKDAKIIAKRLIKTIKKAIESGDLILDVRIESHLKIAHYVNHLKEEISDNPNKAWLSKGCCT